MRLLILSLKFYRYCYVEPIKYLLHQIGMRTRHVDSLQKRTYGPTAIYGHKIHPETHMVGPNGVISPYIPQLPSGWTQSETRKRAIKTAEGR